MTPMALLSTIYAQHPEDDGREAFHAEASPQVPLRVYSAAEYLPTSSCLRA